ncbi:hypothetical protein AC578_8873 [Pseudocercospora eumusae]|uniref:Uncharacterized protein n=1 Tax=Pseudocercospora eumusae TaxID=321146 RepID=A0A139HBK2_9PEZI|nr:hypothetical protein AC578_8873 [Pseudocercospora eumusae]
MGPRPRFGEYDSYWRVFDAGISNESKLTTAELRKKVRAGGYVVPPGTREDAVDRLKRMDKDLPDYDRCLLDELCKFAFDRGLITQEQKTARALSVQPLRNMLRAADDSATFDNFLHLPIAVRAMVYDHYMAEFPLVLEHPTQPPLTRTNKLIRNEALPSFHKASTFKLTFTTLVQKNSGRQTLAFSPQHPPSPLSLAHLYFTTLSEQSIGEIQNWILEWSEGTTTPAYRFHIHFTGNKAQTKVWHTGRGNIADNMKQAIVDAVKEVLDTVADAVPKRKLKHTDIMAMRRKWEAILFSNDNGGEN